MIEVVVKIDCIHSLTSRSVEREVFEFRKDFGNVGVDNSDTFWYYTAEITVNEQQQRWIDDMWRYVDENNISVVKLLNLMG